MNLTSLLSLLLASHALSIAIPHPHPRLDDPPAKDPTAPERTPERQARPAAEPAEGEGEGEEKPPADDEAEPGAGGVVCPRINMNPQCCEVNLLGVASLGCKNAPSVPKTVAEFNAMCAGAGERAQCCALPVLGQGVICNDPIDEA